MNHHRADRRRGFSLVEVLVVITIIAALVGMVAKNVLGQQVEARIQTAEIEIKSLVDALKTFKMREGRWPKKSEGLRTLAEPSGRSKTPIIDQLNPDPWGNEYIYKPPVGSTSNPVVMSYGADGKPGGEGADADISSEKPGDDNES